MSSPVGDGYEVWTASRTEATSACRDRYSGPWG
jgi:hypothetical protein